MFQNGDVDYLVATDAVGMGLNDFFQTTGWDVAAHNAAHSRDLSWLNAQVTALEDSDVKIIVFSHWSPTLDARATDPVGGGNRGATL